MINKIVKLMNDNEFNKNNAQFILSTHQTCLMEKGLLRHDQIWLVEKSIDLSSNIYSMSDFTQRKPRKGI